MAIRISIKLFGDFALSIDDQPRSEVDTARLRSLLAHLAMKRGAHQLRAQLAFLFWPDSSEKQALTNLRNLLHQLRKAIPEAESFIEADAKTICWKSDAALELDVVDFESAIAKAEDAVEAGESSKAVALWKEAVELYHGDFLLGHYDDWVEDIRVSLKQSYLTAVEKLTEFHESEGKLAEAIRFARKWRQADPVGESSHAALMRLYSAAGDRSKALQSYKECAAILKRELDVAPGEKIESLYRELVRKKGDSVSPEGEPADRIEKSDTLKSTPGFEMPEGSEKRLDFYKLAIFFSTLVGIILGVLWIAQREEPLQPDRRSLAVLPFENRSQRPEDVYFTDGIHDDLLTQISKIQDIKTISRASVMSYRESASRIPEIGKALGVATILEGGVQRAGDQIRMNVQLIDVATDSHLWAETYTRKLTVENIFAIQSEIAQTVARELEAALSPDEKARIEKLPTRNLAALEFLFKAKAVSFGATAKGQEEAEAYLLKAIEMDPEFAIPYAALASIYLRQVFYSGRSLEEQTAKAKALIQKAMAIDDQSSLAYQALGTLTELEADFSAADAAFRKAIELNPNSAEAFYIYGNFQLWSTRDHIRALDLAMKAHELDPMGHHLITQLLINAQIANGLFEEARRHVNQLLARNPTDLAALRALCHLHYEGDFRYDEMIRYRYRVIELDPGVPWDYMGIAFGYGLIGAREEELALIRRALEIAPNARNAHFLRGMIHHRLGEKALAIDSLLKLTDKAESFSYVINWLVDLAVEENRIDEVMERLEVLFPAGFHNRSQVNQTNFITAFAYARLKIASGESADHLLEYCLEESRKGAYLTWNSKSYLWEARIKLAQGRKAEALALMRDFIDRGGVDSNLLFHADFASLAGDPEFEEMLSIIEERSAIQRKNLAEMVARGEIPASF